MASQQIECALAEISALLDGRPFSALPPAGWSAWFAYAASGEWG